MGITFEQVATSAEKLKAAGTNPSADAVRDELGTGSKTTILQHLRAWKKAQPAEAVEPRNLPDPLVRAITAEIAEIENDANQRALDEVRKVEKDLDDVTKESAIFQAERDRALEAKAIADAEKLSANSLAKERGERIQALEKQVAEMSEANRKLESEVSGLRAKCEALSESKDELKAERKRTAELQDKVSELLTELATRSDPRNTK